MCVHIECMHINCSLSPTHCTCNVSTVLRLCLAREQDEWHSIQEKEQWSSVYGGISAELYIQQFIYVANYIASNKISVVCTNLVNPFMKAMISVCV